LSTLFPEYLIRSLCKWRHNVGGQSQGFCDIRAVASVLKRGENRDRGLRRTITLIFNEYFFWNIFFGELKEVKGEIRKERRCSPRESDAKHHSGAINLLLQKEKKPGKLKIGRTKMTSHISDSFIPFLLVFSFFSNIVLNEPGLGT